MIWLVLIEIRGKDLLSGVKFILKLLAVTQGVMYLLEEFFPLLTVVAQVVKVMADLCVNLALCLVRGGLTYLCSRVG